MKREEIKEKGIQGVKKIIFGRTLFVIFAFLIQFALLAVTYIWLRDYSYVFYLLFVILSVSVVLHLFNSNESPDFKLVWMLPLVIFPVFGAFFYLYVATQLGTKMIFRRLQFLSKFTRQYAPQNAEVKNRLKEENSQMGHFVQYMEEYDNCPVYDHTQVTYYPLGDRAISGYAGRIGKGRKVYLLESLL